MCPCSLTVSHLRPGHGGFSANGGLTLWLERRNLGRQAETPRRRGEGVVQVPGLRCRRRARALVSSGGIAKTAATARSSPSTNAWLQLGHRRLGAYAFTMLRSSLVVPQPSHTPTPPSCQVTEMVE